VDDFDLVAIGGGNGGYTAAIRATQLGLRAAVVEREKVGGTCLHRGCIPTKALLETAETLSRVRKADTFGIQAEMIAVDYAAVHARKQRVIDTLHKSLRSVIQKHKIEIIEGTARLLSPTQVAVGERRLMAGNVVLATGSRPKELPGLPVDGSAILNSDQILELETPPNSIVIVGGGSIGAEFASFYLDVGSDVTVVEMMPTLLPLEDEDLGKALARSLAARGANILTSARVVPEGTQRSDNVVELKVEQGGETKTVRGDVVLVAVGREAVTDGLGLESTRVKMDHGFINVQRGYRTDDSKVFAVGDAIGGLLLAHAAAAEGFIAAEAVAGKGPESLDNERVPRVTYGRPQVASVGVAERQAREAGRDVKTQRFSFRYNAMALIEDETEGFVKVVSDAGSGDLLGVHIIGHRACELISEAGLARFLEASAWEVGANIHPHPALSEVLGEAAQLSAGVSIYW
jgi:dihydrolipoamide dehydrogenase